MSTKESIPTTTDTKEAQRAYFKQWYENNKKALLERRKKKWRDDPEYRRKNMDRKRESRKKDKQHREAELIKREELKNEVLGRLIIILEEDGLTPSLITKALGYLPNGTKAYPKVEKVGESHQVIYPMGYLCVRLAKSGQTLRLWHERDVLPPATFTDDQNWRWYSWEYIDTCARAVNQVRKSGPWSLSRLKIALEENFGN